jgi:hypothetical protein
VEDLSGWSVEEHAAMEARWAQRLAREAGDEK